MTQEALTALNKSIQHWQQNVEKIKADQQLLSMLMLVLFAKNF